MAWFTKIIDTGLETCLTSKCPEEIGNLLFQGICLRTGMNLKPFSLYFSLTVYVVDWLGLHRLLFFLHPQVDSFL
jgi:hypothetical protein